jgi:plastocyanin
MLPMKTSLKPNLEKIDLLFASPVHNQKHTARRVSVLSPILKHVNTGTLGFAMFIGLALLSSPVVALQFTFTQSRDSQTKESAPVKATKTEVAIDNFSFSPNTVTLSVGATVTWTNHDNVPHVVSSTDNQFKKSPLLKIGQSFSHTFATRGTYNYFCSIHPRMTGNIIVK